MEIPSSPSHGSDISWINKILRGIFFLVHSHSGISIVPDFQRALMATASSSLTLVAGGALGFRRFSRPIKAVSLLSSRSLIGSGFRYVLLASHLSPRTWEARRNLVDLLLFWLILIFKKGIIRYYSRGTTMLKIIIYELTSELNSRNYQWYIHSNLFFPFTQLTINIYITFCCLLTAYKHQVNFSPLL